MAFCVLFFVLEVSKRMHLKAPLRDNTTPKNFVQDHHISCKGPDIDH